MQTASRFIVIGLATVVASAASAQTTPTPPPASSATTLYYGPDRRPPPNSFNRFDAIGSIEKFYANSRQYVTQYQQILSFGRCAANVSSDRSRRLLAAIPNSPTEGLEARRIADLSRGCLPSGFAAPVQFLRAGIAEALYKRLPMGTAIRASGSSAADLAIFEAAEAARDDIRLVDDRAFTTVANCYAVRAPAQVRAMLLSTPGSTSERTALKTVIAAAPACGAGGSLTASGATTFIRAYLAESAYRWATTSTS